MGKYVNVKLEGLKMRIYANNEDAILTLHFEKEFAEKIIECGGVPRQAVDAWHGSAMGKLPTRFDFDLSVSGDRIGLIKLREFLSWNLKMFYPGYSDDIRKVWEAAEDALLWS